MSTFLWFDENGIVVVIVEHYKYTEKKNSSLSCIQFYLSKAIKKEQKLSLWRKNRPNEL